MPPNGGRIHADGIGNCWCSEEQSSVANDVEKATPADIRALRIRNACDALADTLVAKQSAYGPAAITEAPGGPLNGLAVRIFDKHARLQNLVANPQAGAGVQDEALADTALDLAGYGIITGLVLSGQW